MNDVNNEAVIDHQLVKGCWSKIKSAQGSNFFVDSFYRYMFDNHPDVHSFFPEELGPQKTKLLNTLDNVINGIEYVDELKSELLKLGERHKALGIQAEMFEFFVEAIIATANTSSDFTLTKNELLAWESAFRKIIEIMLEAYS